MKHLDDLLPKGDGADTAMVVDTVRQLARQPESRPQIPTALEERERNSVNELFDFFARCFRHLWERDHRDEKARYAWAIALKAAKLTPRQVREGMVKASQLRAPPTAGEFIQLCRPELPEPLAALEEAVAWWRGQPMGDVWSHVTVGVAAAAVGPWASRQLTERELEKRWRTAYARAQSRYFGGETLKAPALLLIAEDRGQVLPGHQPMSPAVAAEVAELSRELGLGVRS